MAPETLARIRLQAAYSDDLRAHRGEPADFVVEHMDDGRVVFKGRPGGFAYRESLQLPEGVTLEADGEELCLKLEEPISFSYYERVGIAHEVSIDVLHGSRLRCWLEGSSSREKERGEKVDRNGRRLEGSSLQQVLGDLLPPPATPILDEAMRARIASVRPGEDPQAAFQAVYEVLTGQGTGGLDFADAKARFREIAQLLSAMAGQPIHRSQLLFGERRPRRSAVDYRGYVSVLSGTRTGTPEQHYYLELTNGQLHPGALCHHTTLLPVPDFAGYD